MAIVPGDGAADHRVLLFVGLVVGTVRCEVVQGGEVTRETIEEAGSCRHPGQLDIVRRRPVPDRAVRPGPQMRTGVVHHDGDAHLGWVQAAQVAAELQELGAVRCGLKVTVEVVGVHLERCEQVPGALGPAVGGPVPTPSRAAVVPSSWREITAPSACPAKAASRAGRKRPSTTPPPGRPGPGAALPSVVS